MSKFKILYNYVHIKRHISRDLLKFITYTNNKNLLLCIFLYFCLLGGYFEYNSERILIVFFYKSKKLLVKKKAVRDLTAGIAVGWLLVVGCFMISDLYFTDFCLLLSDF